MKLASWRALGLGLRLLARPGLRWPFLLIGWPLLLLCNLLALGVLAVTLARYVFALVPPTLLQLVGVIPPQGFQRFARLQMPLLALALLLAVTVVMVLYQAWLLHQGDRLLSLDQPPRRAEDYWRVVLGVGLGRATGLVLGLPLLVWAFWAVSHLSVAVGWGIVGWVLHLALVATLSTALSVALAAQPAALTVHGLGPWQALAPALTFGMAARPAFGGLSLLRALARLLLELPAFVVALALTLAFIANRGNAAALLGTILTLGAAAAIENLLRGASTLAELALYRGRGGVEADPTLVTRPLRERRQPVAPVSLSGLVVASAPSLPGWSPTKIAGSVPRNRPVGPEMPGQTAAVVP